MKMKSEVSPDKPLLARQRKFCDLIVAGKTGTEAAIEAGYSPRSAAMVATENQKKPNLAAYIAKKRARMEEKIGFGREQAIEKLIEDALQTDSLKDRRENLVAVGKWLGWEQPKNLNLTHGGVSFHLDLGAGKE